MIYSMRSRSTGGNFFHQQFQSDAKFLVDLSHPNEAMRPRSVPRSMGAYAPARGWWWRKDGPHGCGLGVILNGLVVNMIADFFENWLTNSNLKTSYCSQSRISNHPHLQDAHIGLTFYFPNTKHQRKITISCSVWLSVFDTWTTRILVV